MPWLDLSEGANSPPWPEQGGLHGMDPPELRGCVLVVLEKLCSGVSLELGLGSAFQIPQAQVTTHSQRDSCTSPWLGMSHGPSATCSGVVLVGPELQLHPGVQSNSVPKHPASPAGVRGRGCALVRLAFSFRGLVFFFFCLFYFFAFIV